MGFLNLFGSKKQNFELPITVDMHSHLLPSIDDGSKSVEESIFMMEQLIALGYQKFICTPHIMGDFYRNTEETIQKSFDILKNALKEKEDYLHSFAAEYYLDEWFCEKLNRNEKLLCLSGNYLLVETSYINKPSNFREIIFELQTKGYQVVLAHPERYTYMYDSFEKFHEMHELGIFFQLNLNSICGYYGPMAQKISKKLIDNKMIEFIGTDCHSQKHIDFFKKTLAENYFGKLKDLKLLNDSLV
jgi:protein-tyrosine phosphatase